MKKEEKEKKEEQKYQRKSAGYVWWLTIVMILLLVAFFGLGYALGSTNIAEDVINNLEKNGKVEKQNKGSQKLDVTDATKQKLEKFINIATDQKEYKAAKQEVRDYFEKGTTSLTDRIKLEMTNLAIYQDKKVESNILLTEEEVNQLSGYKPDIAHNEKIDRVKVSDFTNTYKELFKEDLKFNFDDLSGLGCPKPSTIDNAKENIYYNFNCGGATGGSWGNSIDSYDSDNDYYYVHQTLTRTPAGGETEITKLVWKFDKDLKFVSTTVE